MGQKKTIKYKKYKMIIINYLILFKKKSIIKTLKIKIFEKIISYLLLNVTMYFLLLFIDTNILLVILFLTINILFKVFILKK